MRIIMTTFFLLSFFVLIGQAPVKIKLSCPATTTIGQDPILVLNGDMIEYKKLTTINIDDIDSICVLKNGPALALYGARAVNGVIRITTKERRFRARDIEDGKGIAGATISFVSATNWKDTIVFTTDDYGSLITRDLKKGESYHVRISSVGYKPLSLLYNNTNGELTAFSLEKDIVNCSPVVVIGYGSMGCRRISCCCLVTKATNGDIKKKKGLDFEKSNISGVVYPNPVQRGLNVAIEFSQFAEQLILIKLLNLNGQVLSSKTERTSKGLNRFFASIDQRLSAGVYFIQVAGDRGVILKQEKIVVK